MECFFLILKYKLDILLICNQIIKLEVVAWQHSKKNEYA